MIYSRFLVLPFLMFIHLSFAEDVITMGSDPWLPYVGDPAKQHGYVIEIAEKIFTQSGIATNFAITPWARVVKNVRDGSMVAAPGALVADAPDFIVPSEPIGSYRASLFVLKGHVFKYTSTDSLKNKRLGVINNYLYTPDIDVYLKQPSANIEVVSGSAPLETLIKMMQLSRIDVIVENPTVFWYHTALNKIDKNAFEEIEIPQKTQPLYILFSPKIEKSKQYADILDAGIIEMRKNGELQKILAKYNVTDWKH